MRAGRQGVCCCWCCCMPTEGTPGTAELTIPWAPQGLAEFCCCCCCCCCFVLLPDERAELLPVARDFCPAGRCAGMVALLRKLLAVAPALADFRRDRPPCHMIHPAASAIAQHAPPSTPPMTATMLCAGAVGCDCSCQLVCCLTKALVSSMERGSMLALVTPAQIMNRQQQERRQQCC